MTKNYFSPSFKLIIAGRKVKTFSINNKENSYWIHILFLGDRLGGVMVKASALRAEDCGSIPGRVMPKTLKMEF